ncbi:MAG: helix-turn-helix domain-containing protein [Candidatus Obscuribacterales bacterium]|nr:helix-turn-helix domain-containing protein [Candidatus Obscuribacterales bacterium]
MIKNQKQLNSTKAKLRKWLKNKEQLLAGASKGEPEWLIAEQTFGVDQQIKQLQSEIQKYEDTVAGNVTLPDPCLVSEIPQLLISWRIVRHWTQKDLANRVGLHENQIQKYESEDYRAASLQTLTKIAAILCNNESAEEHTHHLFGHSLRDA